MICHVTIIMCISLTIHHCYICMHVAYKRFLCDDIWINSACFLLRYICTRNLFKKVLFDLADPQ